MCLQGIGNGWEGRKNQKDVDNTEREREWKSQTKGGSNVKTV
jgi:hypothetical protein